MPEQKHLLFNLSDEIVGEIYDFSLKLPYIHQRSIGDQLRRSSLSIVLNIVEGGARLSPKEKRQFLNITFGSLKETKYLIGFCYAKKLLDEVKYRHFLDKLNRLAALIYGLIHKAY